jgi:hypothetical protein
MKQIVYLGVLAVLTLALSAPAVLAQDPLVDVGGNVNIDGNLMFKGQSGQPGQILGTNSSGDTHWVNFSQFENLFASYQNGSGTWNIPSGVTKIGIELQGGGGAGSTTGGGAGGNYVAFIIDVSFLTTVTYLTGIGGISGGAVDDGSPSQVTIDFNLYSAGGGEGAPLVQRGGFNNDDFPGPSSTFRVLGQPGTANDYSYMNAGTDSVFKTQYGSGGGTYPSFTMTPGGTRLKNVTTNTDLNITLCTAPVAYGAGGAANITLSSANHGRGGYVKIHY